VVRSRKPFKLWWAPTIGDAEFAGVENAGVEFSAPNIRAGKRRSGNLGRRKSMESEVIIIADCIG